MTNKEQEVILSTEEHTYPWVNYIAIYEYVKLKVEAIDDSKMHFMPQQCCPNPECEDFGIFVYRDEAILPKQAIFYCYHCHVHYYIRYTERKKPDSERVNYQGHKPDYDDEE